MKALEEDTLIVKKFNYPRGADLGPMAISYSETIRTSESGSIRSGF